MLFDVSTGDVWRGIFCGFTPAVARWCACSWCPLASRADLRALSYHRLTRSRRQECKSFDPSKRAWIPKTSSGTAISQAGSTTRLWTPNTAREMCRKCCQTHRCRRQTRQMTQKPRVRSTVTATRQRHDLLPRPRHYRLSPCLVRGPVGFAVPGCDGPASQEKRNRDEYIIVIQ